MMKRNFILSCKRAFSDVLEGVVLKIFLGASPHTPILHSLRPLVHPTFLWLAPPLSLTIALQWPFGKLGFFTFVKGVHIRNADLPVKSIRVEEQKLVFR